MNVVEDITQTNINHEDKSMLKTNQMRRHSKNNTMSETLQIKKFGGGVTHRIGSIRPRHDAQLSWRSEVKFHINVLTLRM